MGRLRSGGLTGSVVALLSFFALSAPSAWAADPVSVDVESELRAAWANPRVSHIRLTSDIALRACKIGDPIRESPFPVDVDGGGHAVRQTCFEKRLLRQDGTGFVRLHDITLKRGGSDGPGAAVTTRGEIEIVDSRISENLAEEPGGGVFSMRRATIIRSVMTGNLANDDGGAVYARRGGVLVVDSALNGNLVDGSGGAIGSTGDVVVVRSHLDGNTTDGDGGAIYTDEDGDVTVIDSTVDGSTADGPGGAIFTLDGDVTIVNSTLNGNRADDRGGAISGEADVTIIGSTVARNAAVAHVGGGVWARGDLFVSNSTIARNYAEGSGGGIFGAGDVGIAYSTVMDNIAPIAGSIAAGGRLETFGSVIGPPRDVSTGQAQPTTSACRASITQSHGYNLISDHSCRLQAVGDVEDNPDPLLGELFDNGGFGETRLPLTGSPVIDRIPKAACRFAPFGYDEEGEQHLAAEGIDPIAPISTDQRGARRSGSPGCDIGATEFGAVVPPAQLGPAVQLRVPRVIEAPVMPPPSPQDDSPRRDSAGASADFGPAHFGTSRASILSRIDRQMDRISADLRAMEHSTDNYRHWRTCVSQVPVSEYGDGDGQSGYRYDEVDGSGRGFHSALALDRRKRGRPDFRLFDFDPRPGCESARTVPGGTADPARAPGRMAPRAGRGGGGRPSLGRMEDRLAHLDRRAERVDRAAEGFDEWESCLSWIPITEYGDPETRFGYEYRRAAGGDAYNAAVTIDRSEWDDPDYEFLAFKGRDDPRRPGECGNEPGEEVDRIPAPATASDSYDLARGSRSDRIEDLAGDVGSMAESVDDLFEPVEEFDLFDQCMFTIGVSQYGSRDGDSGYRYFDGSPGQRPALAMDLSGFDPAEHYFLVFPGEEPPQIECNEDAGGEGTDE